MTNRRYLLIKAWGCGFWSDVDHVMGQLLVAELTNRSPVVYWGTNSLYGESFKTNAFELYFEPVSQSTVSEVINSEYSYYPPVWSSENVLIEDLDKIAWMYRNLGEMINSNADVVVSDVHYFIRPIINFISKEHWAYGMTAHQIYRVLFDKYIRLKPDITQEVQEFYDNKLKNSGPLLGVHIRGGDKVREVENLSRLNKQYHNKIKEFITKYDIGKILLLTDCEEILEEFLRLYGSKVVYTDCRRGQLNATEDAPHLQDYSLKRRKGIEIIKDTYLAAQCNFFIGNGYSNVSYTVKRLKDWPEQNIILFYRDLKGEVKLAKKRVKAEGLRRKAESEKHRLHYPEFYGGVNTYVDR